MVEESLSNTVPQVGHHPRPDAKSMATGDSQTEVKKSTSAKTSGRPVERKHRLTLHLIIGFLMVSIAVGGYALHVPDVSAAATDKAGYRMVDAATNIVTAVPESQTAISSDSIMSVSARTSDFPTIYKNIPTSDVDRLQAEMAEITRRINALQAENLAVAVVPNTGISSPLPGSNSTGVSIPNKIMTGDNPGHGLTKADQMMSMMNDMMSMMNSMAASTRGTSNPKTGTSSQTSGSGHH